MSDYEVLRKDLDGIAGSLARYVESVSIYTEVVNERFAELWNDNAELRDELHAVANRLEALTRGLTTEPAEVAQMIVNDEVRKRKERWGV